MKQLLVIAIALIATNAHASRARVQSLGGAAHILDTQSVYLNPAKMFLMGDFVALESGKTQTNTTPSAADPKNNAEGLIVYSVGASKLGFSVGHKSDNASGFGLRALLGGPAGAFVGAPGSVGGNANLLIEQQNPIELSYAMKSGDIAWGAMLIYSNFEEKATGAERKESSGGLRFGALTGAWDFALAIGTHNKVNAKAATPGVVNGTPVFNTGHEIALEGTRGYSANVGYKADSLYTYGEVVLAGAKVTNKTANAELGNVTQDKITVGVIDSLKKDNNEFFYGAKLVSLELKNKVSDKKKSELSLPVIVGFETEATTWLVVRGSLTQTVLLNNKKDETAVASGAGVPAPTEYSPGKNDTTAAFGAGLKFNKLTVDGTMLAAGTANSQKINSSNLLTTIGLTYMF